MPLRRLVIERLGRLPAAGERVRFPEFEVEVLSMDGPRIERVRVRPAAAEPVVDD